MTTPAAGRPRDAWGRPAVFPWSVAGAPRHCTCNWVWSETARQFFRLHRNERCNSMAHVSEVIMTGPPPAAPDAGEANTTLQISKAQRATIGDIQADLTIKRGRHVGTKETLAAILEYWQEGHGKDES